MTPELKEGTIVTSVITEDEEGFRVLILYDDIPAYTTEPFASQSTAELYAQDLWDGLIETGAVDKVVDHESQASAPH